MTSVNSLIQQVLGSSDPSQAFQQILNSSKEAQEAMNLINQYGNGDPKAAFENLAAAQGKRALAEQIKQRMGLS